MKAFLKKLSKLLSISLSLAIILTVLPMNTVEVHAAASYTDFNFTKGSSDLSGTYNVGSYLYSILSKVKDHISVKLRQGEGNMRFENMYDMLFIKKPLTIEIIDDGSNKIKDVCKVQLLENNTAYRTYTYPNPADIDGKITISNIPANSSQGSLLADNVYKTNFYLKTVRVYYHDFSSISSDATGHWSKCPNCGSTKAKESHSFTAEEQTATYLKSAATCTSPAEYYYKCATCAEKGTETYYSGNALGHSLGYFAKQDSTCTEDGWNAYYECEICKKVYTNENGTGTEYANEATWKSSTVGKIAALGHNFQYSASDDTISAICQNDNLHKAELLLDAEDATYTGSAIKNATVTSWSPDTYNTLIVTAPTDELIKYYKVNSDSSLTESDPINAGNYVAKVSITKDSNTYTAQKAFKIDPRHIDQTTIASTYNNSVTPPVYDGTTTFEQTITITDNASGTTKTLTKDVDYQLSGTLSSLLPGEFTATVTGIGNYTGTAEIEWEVEPAKFTLGGGEGQIGTVTVTPYSGTYDGQEHSINVAAPADATVTYSTSETGPYTDTNPTFKDAGDHKVYFKVNKEGYSELSGNSDVIITHKIVDVSWSVAADNIFTYDGQPKAPTATITNKVTVNGVTDDVSVVIEGAATNARPLSPYTAIAEGLAGTDAKNYKLPITKPSCEFTINKAKVDIPQPLQTTYTYNRKEQALLSTSTLYTITNNTRTNAGSQEVAVELNDKNNYEWNTTDASEKIADQLYTFTIERRDISDEARVVMPTTRFFIEDDDETPGFTVELQVFDKIDNDDKELVKGIDKEYSVAGDTQVNPGTFDLYITFNGNYTGSILKRWSIYEDKRHELPVELPDDGNAYDGEVTLIGAGDEEVPEFELSNPLDLLTPEEKDLLKKTGHNSNEKYVIEIILSLNTNNKEDLDEESLAAIEEKINNPTGEHYYDISIRKVIKKYVDSSLYHTETHYATSTDSPIELKIHVPDEVPSVKGGYSRKYSMIRSHKNADGTYTADVLDVTYIRPDEDHPNGAVVFKSDKFSDYALTYKDTLIPRSYKAPDTSVR